VEPVERLAGATLAAERTGMYSQRVPGVVPHFKASMQNLQEQFDTPCKPENLRAALPCALSRSTAHPVHKSQMSLTEIYLNL